MKKIKRVFLILLLFLFLFLTFLLNFSIKWVFTNYNNITIEEIVFTLTSNVAKTESSLLIDFIKDALLPSLIISLLTILFLKIIDYIFNRYKIIIKVSFFKTKYTAELQKLKIKKMLTFLIIIGILTVTLHSLRTIKLFDYIKYIYSDSSFIQENYVDPKKTKILFPKNKQNLIYIYVESLESTFFSKKYGGYEKNNLLPGLTELTNENLQFSNKEKFGGALTLYGTGWTSAAMVAQTSGLPVKVSMDSDFSQTKSYLKGAYSLGNILKSNGYNNYLVIGSDAKFGDRELYFKTHGDYKIYDYNTAIKENFIDKDYYVWWGMEDSKLFDYAKIKLTEISAKKEPFNFTMLTSNTHHPEGFLESSCTSNFNDQLANVIACNSFQINDFIEWIKKQSFYKNTTIVIVGDHVHMNQDYFKNISANNRRVYNLFINSKIKPSNNKNREFSTIDMFPTTIASLGGTIEGNRLGLGVNLYSNEKTLIEKYGIVKVNSELAKNSSYYNKKILKK